MHCRIYVVIPAYNSQDSIADLLSSIYHSKRISFRDIDIIVVDDHSKDKTIEEVQRFILKHPKLRVKILALRKNKGPAHARNYGAKLAGSEVKRRKGEETREILFFLDSDVVLHQNSLFALLKSFDDPDIHALTGVWDKKQNSDDFFPKFKALRDWSYWINERDPKHYYYLFSTRVAAIEKGLFLRLGGFDETYKAALIEDIELTYRIAKRYAVIFNPEVSVHHEFESFVPVAKKYFWRSYFWSKIYRERKKFDPVAATNKEAITTISAAMALILYAVGIFASLLSFGTVALIFYFGALVMLCIHLIGVRKFLQFVLREEGFIFMLGSFLVGYTLYLVILSGAASSYLSRK